MGGTTMGVTLAALLAAGVGVAGLWWFSRDELDAGSVVRGLLAGVGAAGLLLIPLVATGLRDFGLLHYVYLGFTVATPIFGVALLVRSFQRTHPRPLRFVAALFLVPALLGYYATHIEPNRLVVDHVAVPVAPSRTGRQPVRIAVLADLQTNHIGGHERQAIDRLMAAKPDVILVPGDIFQSDLQTFKRWLPELRRLLNRLRAPGGVFVVQGDVDGQDSIEYAFADNPDARILDNEVVRVRVRDRVLRIGGTRLNYDDRAAREVKRKLEQTPDDGSYRILLSHRPDTVFGLSPSSRVDLTVAGHTHGGQIVMPFFGPLVTMSQVPRHVARGGLHTMSGNRIYVSPGVGLERFQAPQVRFNDPPTIGILELADAAREG